MGIYSNCPQKITHITTINNGLSDHATLTATYHTKAPINNPKIIYTRPKYLLTEHNLNAYLNNNDIIQTAYNYTNPELIAEIIMREFNNIIEIIAPRTKRQVKKNYTPYLNKETREAKKKLNEMHNKAKQTQQDDDWREYKNQRAIINKQVDTQKQEYITKRLNNSENRWKTLNDINNKSTFESPRSIIHKDAITTNIQEICNIANNYYINSIKTLRERIPQTAVTPIDILKKIYKRQQTTLEIPIPTIPQIAQIIKKAKSTNSVGHDNISMKMLKKTTTIMAPLITHLIKQIIIERKFPSIFKTDRITPKLKNGKPIYDIASYRPLNNLCTIEKIIEEYIITHLEPFLTTNKLIHDNHHGGRKGHSTTMALTQILTKSQTAKENQQITGCLITDMSKAFDTIDHLTLLMKMEYYGIRGTELEIFKSYLINRQQFVEIDTHRSKTRTSNPCSVIQGSKLSGILYTIYTNEIPQLYTLMQDNIYM